MSYLTQFGDGFIQEEDNEFEREELQHFQERHPIALKEGMTYACFKKLIVSTFKSYDFCENYLVHAYQSFVLQLSLSVPEVPDPVKWFMDYDDDK